MTVTPSRDLTWKRRSTPRKLSSALAMTPGSTPISRAAAKAAVAFRTLSNSAIQRSRIFSFSLNSRDTLRSKMNCPGPVPALRAKFPDSPIVGRLNWLRIDGSKGSPCLRQRSTLVSPVKFGLSLPTSSRFRSAPPNPMLNGALDASLKIGEKRR